MIFTAKVTKKHTPLTVNGNVMFTSYSSQNRKPCSRLNVNVSLFPKFHHIMCFEDVTSLKHFKSCKYHTVHVIPRKI